MGSPDEIEKFLKDLKEKIKIFDIAFRGRRTNISDLGELGIMPSQRKDCILGLTLDNYSTGPNKDNYDTTLPDYYEFGAMINDKEVYIKLSPGLPNKKADCMSFHIAKKPLSYPYRKK